MKKIGISSVVVAVVCLVVGGALLTKKEARAQNQAQWYACVATYTGGTDEGTSYTRQCAYTSYSAQSAAIIKLCYSAPADKQAFCSATAAASCSPTHEACVP